MRSGIGAYPLRSGRDRDWRFNTPLQNAFVNARHGYYECAIFAKSISARQNRPLMPPVASLHAVPNGKDITLEAGQSLAEAATRPGRNPRNVWEHPNNAALREARPVPLHLRAGDTLFLPAIMAKEETVAVNARHASCYVRIRSSDNGTWPPPVAESTSIAQDDVGYRPSTANGDLHEGRLNADGWARIDDLQSDKECKMCFPSRNQDAWVAVAA